jgi:hypothetical protein
MGMSANFITVNRKEMEMIATAARDRGVSCLAEVSLNGDFDGEWATANEWFATASAVVAAIDGARGDTFCLATVERDNRDTLARAVANREGNTVTLPFSPNPEYCHMAMAVVFR